jgi:Cytochrome c554 and c-prime
MARVAQIILLLAWGSLFAIKDVSANEEAGTTAKQPVGMREGYAGDSECKSCHSQTSLTFSRTAHHLTSAIPMGYAVLGSFAEGSNELRVSDTDGPGPRTTVTYKMQKNASGYYVSAVSGSASHITKRTERIGIVIGSGVRGQSYLYWRGDELYELPISYWADGKQWIISPGFSNGPPVFDRPASPRCLECHVTYLEPLSPDPADNRYERATLVAGISCEVCHGPGARHVALHRRGGATTFKDEAITNPAHSSRDRQVDMCALCHNGAQQTLLGEAFSYKPGQPLSEYLRANPADDLLRPDVHANQVGLLKRSRCYLNSPQMSCSTCHEVHAPELAAAFYSPRCLTCHRVESCGMEKKLGAKIADNCVDCHMPVLQTNAIVSQTGNKVIRTQMRTHWIKVYAATEKP